MLAMVDVHSSGLIGLPDTLTIAFPTISSHRLKPRALVYMVLQGGLENLMVFRCTDQEPYVTVLKFVDDLTLWSNRCRDSAQKLHAGNFEWIPIFTTLLFFWGNIFRWGPSTRGGCFRKITVLFSTQPWIHLSKNTLNMSQPLHIISRRLKLKKISPIQSLL